MIKNKNLFYILVLGIIFIFGYIMFLGSYPLLDVDETRYVDMAKEMFHTKNYLTLYLNGDYFFEKPPLFFWIECFSFKIFNSVNELSSRLPLVLLSLLPLVLLFNLAKKVKGIKFAFIVSGVLLTCVEYAIITRVAILDTVLTTFSVSSVLSYFYTFFVKEKNKKYFWLLTYIFSGLAVLAKGIPGAAIPFLTIAVSTIVFKKYKETFLYSILGLIVFFLIILPWHLVMLKTYPNLFYQEYIYKHHILRFLGSGVIHRNEPFYFYILTLLWGLLPHTFILLAQLFKKETYTKRLKVEDDYSKLLRLSTICVLCILIFFSSSKTKLITYIVPVYPFLSIIIGNLWLKFIEKKNEEYRFRNFTFGLIVFAFLIGVITPVVFKIDYSFGQDELMKYAKIAKDNNYSISTFETGRKYSLLYYSGLKKVNFYFEGEVNKVEEDLKNNNILMIVRNEDIDKLDNIEYKIKIKGDKYSVIEGSNYHEE